MRENPKPDTHQPLSETDEEDLSFGYHPFWGFAGIFVGVLIIFASSWLETAALRDKPWINALHGTGEEPPWVKAMPIQIRAVPDEAFPQVQEFVQEMRDSIPPSQRGEIDMIIEATRALETEAIISAPISDEALAPLLASGRLPVPGEPELLAGVYARLTTFDLDGQSFTVVGRLRSSVAGFHFSYLVPAHDNWHAIFEEHPAAKSGWLDPDGRTSIPEEKIAEIVADYDLSASQVPIEPRITSATITGLLMIAMFGLMAHLSVFRGLYHLPCGPLRPALRVILTRPKTVIAMHLLLYGGFFGMMLVATRLPLPQMWLTNLIQFQFQEGDLAHVGDAYASGNVWNAGWMTFYNNYIVQNLGLTIGASLVFPCIGILKTLLSFLLVGFGMVPTWSGMTSMYTFHSITMTLELEAYIFTCVCVLFFWVHIFAGLFKGNFGKRLGESIRALLSVTLLSAIMLALAGLYEAATLIFLAGG
jgi:hypothetical protein